MAAPRCRLPATLRLSGAQKPAFCLTEEDVSLITVTRRLAMQLRKVARQALNLSSRGLMPSVGFPGGADVGGPTARRIQSQHFSSRRNTNTETPQIDVPPSRR